MATKICFYFQVHQPWRLRPYRFLEVGKNHHYFDDEKNAAILRKVANKCYLPMNNVLYDLLTEYKGEFKVAFSITGTALEQMDAYAPEVISSFKRLFETGMVELLSETSHHSLASLYSPKEFRRQVERHRQIASKFLIPPSNVFRNTELITSNAIAKMTDEMGYRALLMEGADHILRWRSPLFVYRMKGAENQLALLKNYRLSDDIAFRFSDRGWTQWPLTSEKFAEWVRLIEIENPVAAKGGTPFVGLFMDYETFGEHQWADTGIFDFMRALPGKLLSTGFAQFVTPSQMLSESPAGELDAPVPFSWADIERDLSAWVGNPIQDSAIRAAYRLEEPVMKSGDEELIETWRRLLTSDHFYYMCTKYFADGDVHKYFNPYDSPYDAHILYMNVMADMALRCGLEEQAIA
jgi:alpha-amylase